MKLRRLAYVCMTLSFIMIMSGSVSFFISSLKNDQREVLHRISTVNDEFEEFSTKVSLFEERRELLYSNYLGDFYFDNMYQISLDLMEQLAVYENLVNDIENNITELDSLCKNIYYPDGKVNSKCINYKSIYEQVVNYFVSDISLYNSYVKKYNTYQKEQDNFIKINEYHTEKKYIDYNKDKKYDGKEED